MASEKGKNCSFVLLLGLPSKADNFFQVEDSFPFAIHKATVFQTEFMACRSVDEINGYDKYCR